MKWLLARNAEKPVADKTKQLTAFFCAAAAGVKKGLFVAVSGVKRFLNIAFDKTRYLGAFRRIKALFASLAKTIRQWICHVIAAISSLIKRTVSGANTLVHSIKKSKPHEDQPAATAALRPLAHLRSATSQLRLNIMQRTCGKGEFLAKLVLSATAILMGITFLLIIVYSIIPSAIADTAHLFEHDIAVEQYRRTLKDADVPAFRQTMVRQDISFPRDCFASVLKDNPDIVGRLTISGMGLGYLVTQFTDNVFYTNTGYNRKESDSGTIFLDCRCNADTVMPQGHYILYGKNLSAGTMFGHLWYFRDEKFFFANPVIRFDTLYEDYEWEVFSVYVAKPDFYFEDTAFSSEQDWLEFIKLLQSKSLYETDIRLASDDALLTLYTDSGDSPGARLVVHARLLK